MWVSNCTIFKSSDEFILNSNMILGKINGKSNHRGQKGKECPEEDYVRFKRRGATGWWHMLRGK